MHLGCETVDFFLFDTYEGMSSPGELDIHRSTGISAESLLAENTRDSIFWAYAPIDEVRLNIENTGYPRERIHLVKGLVEETIPGSSPEKISILRLDTDWYQSTKHELTHLFPRLSRNGILIIDDYGDWAGARKAVDEYFAEQGMRPFLSRIDGTGRIYVKA